MNKWIIYAVTFLTYSTIHSIRTCWSSLKPFLIHEPYNMNKPTLGVLDMLVLFTLAIGINVFGGFAEKYNCRKLLFGTMVGLIINLCVLGTFLLLGVTIEPLYITFYGLTMGFLSCMGWPVCLYVLSQYFSKSETLALSMWNGVSQFGDFIALIFTVLIRQTFNLNGGYSLFCIAVILLIMLLVDIKFLKERPRPVEEENRGDAERQQQSSTQNEGQGEQTVNFINVWCLPGVALPILSFSIVKSINAIIVGWLVLQLFTNGLKTESRIITLAWSFSILGGGFIGAKINAQLSYRKFIVALLIATGLFSLLEKISTHPDEFQTFTLIILTGLVTGGPYSQLGTAVPVMLGHSEEIRRKPGAKACIIALMEGFGQFMCGISVLIVPEIGVINLHLMALVYCILAAILLTLEEVRKYYVDKQDEQSEHTELNEVS